MLDFLSNNVNLLAGGGVATVVLWVLKKVPNDRISSIVETFFYGLGKTMTLGLSKWSFSKKFWNGTVEPWFIDLVDNTAGACIRGFIQGLRSDG